ncbi:MAG: hypothetical protein JNM17_17760 [Archangium sp.]|nr:hypothetical protein [Archangium sp.]
MPVLSCATGCPRLISVSAVPGGNPVAKEDPEHWAMIYGQCATCKSNYCDRCIEKSGSKNCPKDQTPLTMLGPVPLAAPTAPPSQPTATSTKPWWKFWG